MREDDTLRFTQLAAVFRRLINEANANLKHMHSGGDNLQTCSWLSVTSCSPRIPSVNIKKHQLSLKLPAPMSHGLWRHPFWNPGQTVTLVKESQKKGNDTAEWEDFSDLKNSVQSPPSTEAGRKPWWWCGSHFAKWKLGQSTQPARMNEGGESPHLDLLTPGIQRALHHSQDQLGGGFLLA